MGLPKITPDSIIIATLKPFQDLLEHLVARMEEDEFAPKYISGIMDSIKSFCENNDVKLERKITIENKDVLAILEEEHVLLQSETQNSSQPVLERQNMRNIARLFGSRLEPLGNLDGTDGVMPGDLPEDSVNLAVADE